MIPIPVLSKVTTRDLQIISGGCYYGKGSMLDNFLQGKVLIPDLGTYFILPILHTSIISQTQPESATFPPDADQRGFPLGCERWRAIASVEDESPKGRLLFGELAPLYGFSTCHNVVLSPIGDLPVPIIPWDPFNPNPQWTYFELHFENQSPGPETLYLTFKKTDLADPLYVLRVTIPTKQSYIRFHLCTGCAQLDVANWDNRLGPIIIHLVVGQPEPLPPF